MTYQDIQNPIREKSTSTLKAERIFSGDTFDFCVEAKPAQNLGLDKIEPQDVFRYHFMCSCYVLVKYYIKCDDSQMTDDNNKGGYNE